MERKMRHMGMDIMEKEHEQWHKKHTEITQEQHKTLVNGMGISEEEDNEWHRIREMPRIPNRAGPKTINPFAIGGGFLDYCVKQGWLVREGKGRNVTYSVTKEDEEELKRLSIEVRAVTNTVG